MDTAFSLKSDAICLASCVARIFCASRRAARAVEIATAVASRRSSAHEETVQSALRPRTTNTALLQPRRPLAAARKGSAEPLLSVHACCCCCIVIVSGVRLRHRTQRLRELAAAARVGKETVDIECEGRRGRQGNEEI